MWIAVLCSLKLLLFGSYRLLGVFNRMLNFFPNVSELEFLPTESESSNVLCVAHVELNDDAGGALRAAAKRGLAIEL